MKTSNESLFIMTLSMIIITILTLNSVLAQTKGNLDNNSNNPMIIYSESWNPYYNNSGGNATITNIKNVTIKNNILANTKPYSILQKNITLKMGDVELRNNGTVFKNCILEGDLNGDGKYYILQFQLLNQTQIRDYDNGTSQINLTFQEYPDLPPIICKFTTDLTGTALQIDYNNKADKMNNKYYLIIGILLILIFTWLILKKK